MNDETSGRRAGRGTGWQMTETSERPGGGVIEGAPFAGRHAVVTGATRGIGAAVAETLARLGADLTLMGRDEALLAERKAELDDRFACEAFATRADVTDEASVEAAFDAAAEAKGAVAILVNSAGVASSAPFHRMGLDHWREMIDTNLTGTFLCMRRAYPAMREAGWGRIVNIGSTTSLRAYSYIAAYTASKHGVLGLTRALALEAARTGVTVNVVCPGYTETDMSRHAIDNIVEKTGRTAEEALADITVHNPQGRLIQPWEVAEAVAWVCLPASAAITGQAIAVASGEVM